MTARSSKDWDVVKGDSLKRIVVGDGYKPLPNEQQIFPDEITQDAQETADAQATDDDWFAD